MGRRQEHKLFTFSVDLDFTPEAIPAAEGVEVGVSVFLTQNHHLDLGVVLLRANLTDVPDGSGELVPHIRVRGMPDLAVPGSIVEPLPSDWVGKKLTLEIRASNAT